MNNLPAGAVLPGMCTDSQHGRPARPATPPDGTSNPTRRRRSGRWRPRRWRPRRRNRGGPSRTAPRTGTTRDQAAAAAWPAVPAAPGEAVPGEAAPAEAVPGEAAPADAVAGEAVAAAVQLAIGLLTAGLDSPQLEGWAVEALAPHDADGLGNFMAGLHVAAQLLLHELHQATGEPPEHTLQRLAIQAEHWRGTPFAG